MANALLFQMRDPFHLDHRVGIEQAFDLEQGHSRIVTAKVRAMNFAQLLQLCAVGVARVLPGQHQQPPALDDDAMTEAARTDEFRRIDNFPLRIRGLREMFSHSLALSLSRSLALSLVHLPENSGFCLFLKASKKRR